MYGNQTLMTTLSADQLAELLRGIVRSELASFVPLETKVTTLPDFPSRRETRDILGVTYGTLENWAKPHRGQPARLIPYKVGRRVRYRRDDVLALLREVWPQQAVQPQPVDCPQPVA